MGRSPPVRGAQGSIAAQAARRLLFSLSLLVLVIVVSSVTLYRAAIQKAGSERADDLRNFYAARILQQERDWELQAKDLRVRIEYSRLLEDPRDPVLKLQAFMTVQGTDRHFHGLRIEDPVSTPVFVFGHENPAWAHEMAKGARYYLDANEGLYRVMEEPIWLGNRGMGRLLLFFRVDNALLGHLAAPGVELTVRYQGRAVASSVGFRGLIAEGDTAGQERTIPWAALDDPVQLTIQAPVTVLFTPTELGLAASAIPVIDGLILWFTLGTWLMRQTRRINALEQAVRDSSVGPDGRDRMELGLRDASAGLQDEIAAVAGSLRRATAEREAAEARAAALNEELVARNAELEAVNSELESFIYSVSHDLRAPLRAIAGYACVVEEDYGMTLDGAGNGYLKRISANAESMARRIDDLLYLSRLSRQEVERTTVDITAIAWTIIGELRERESGRMVEVSVGENIVAVADERLMTVALSNLISNAWKFTQHTAGARVEVGATLRDGRWNYWVRDNGAGFDPSLVRKLFMPFHRLHSDQEFEGTGLGLAIVERVIRRHGGRIWAEGEVDGGAAFHFTLQ